MRKIEGRATRRSARDNRVRQLSAPPIMGLKASPASAAGPIMSLVFDTPTGFTSYPSDMVLSRRIATEEGGDMEIKILHV